MPRLLFAEDRAGLFELESRGARYVWVFLAVGDTPPPAALELSLLLLRNLLWPRAFRNVTSLIIIKQPLVVVNRTVVVIDVPCSQKKTKKYSRHSRGFIILYSIIIDSNFTKSMLLCYLIVLYLFKCTFGRLISLISLRRSNTNLPSTESEPTSPIQPIS